MHACVCAKSLQLCLILCSLMDCVAHQASLSVGFSRQEYWGGLACPPPGNLPNPVIEPTSLRSPTLADRFFTTSATWETHILYVYMYISLYIFFIHSSVHEHLDCFHVLVIVWGNTAAMNIGVLVSFQITFFSRYVPRSRLARSCVSSNFSFLRNSHTALHNGCITVHSRQ